MGDRLGSLEPPSAAESVPGEAPPSVRWRGSLLDAYLGGGGSVPEEADPLAYQRLLLGTWVQLGLLCMLCMLSGWLLIGAL